MLPVPIIPIFIFPFISLFLQFASHTRTLGTSLRKNKASSGHVGLNRCFEYACVIAVMGMVCGGPFDYAK